ncbi:MAG: alginate export family protein [Phycisphaerae bacterium]|jgi:hypothetical protein
MRENGCFAIRVSAAAILILSLVQTSHASDKGDSDTSTKQLLQLKNPTSWLELGADFRFRITYDEARKLDQNAIGHDRVESRYRGRFKAKIKYSQDLDFNIQLITEPRYYHRPPSLKKQFIRNEILFNQLNFVLRNAFGSDTVLTVGRQELKLGSGWLISDGTPLDGSRTNFFNAVRATYEMPQWNTTVDMIWIENHGDSAKWLKPFNDQDIDLAEQDERGAIVYLSKQRGEDSRLDGYFIYKQDHNRRISSGYQGEIYTFGVVLAGRLDDNWTYVIEAAPQFGHKNGKKLNALGSNNQLTYDFRDGNKNKVSFGYEYLSGNDDQDKYFDKVWGRIDTWSVLYQGTIDSIDGRAYDNSNLHRIYLSWAAEPWQNTCIQVAYNLLFADENTSQGGTGGLSKSGNFRGQLLRAQIEQKISKSLSHRLEGELFIPGDYYNDDRNDVAVFARYGITWTW